MLNVVDINIHVELFELINIEKPDSSRQGQARNSDFELWSGYDSGLPTGPAAFFFREIILACCQHN